MITAEFIVVNNGIDMPISKEPPDIFSRPQCNRGTHLSKAENGAS